MNLPASLDQSVKQLIRSARANNTVRAYAADMRVFADWCSTYPGYDPLHPTPGIVAAFLADQAPCVSVATISRRLAAIRHFCRVASVADPIDDTVREVLRGIRRTLGTSPVRAKTPLTVEHIRQIVGRIELNTLAGLRDRAMILLGFAAALRRSELVALDIEHVESVAEGLLIKIPRSKTDQNQEGQVIAVVPGSAGFDPIAALRAWTDAALISSGPLFCAVNVAGRTRRLTDHSVAQIIKRRAERAGIDPTTVSGHSLRSGFVTSASLAGANLLKVAQQTRHTNLRSVQRYFKADLFQQHPGRGLL